MLLRLPARLREQSSWYSWQTSDSDWVRKMSRTAWLSIVPTDLRLARRLGNMQPSGPCRHAPRRDHRGPLWRNSYEGFRSITPIRLRKVDRLLWTIRTSALRNPHCLEGVDCCHSGQQNDLNPVPSHRGADAYQSAPEIRRSSPPSSCSHFGTISVSFTDGIKRPSLNQLPPPWTKLKPSCSRPTSAATPAPRRRRGNGHRSPIRCHQRGSEFDPAQREGN